MSEINPTFLARLEDVLELYEQAADPLRPIICLDEKGKELSHTPRGELPLQKGQAKRVDYEYQREGSGNLFVVYQPAVGYRQVWVSGRRQGKDIAKVFKDLVDEVYPQAEVIRIVCDNLNIHTAASLYAAYEPQEARRIARKLEFHYTPVHASWLNMVEIELGVMSKQALKGRIGTLGELEERVKGWEKRRNQQAARINWQFTCAKARLKFHRFYPKLS